MMYKDAMQTGRSAAWPSASALGAESRRFESDRPDLMFSSRVPIVVHG
jgi:hypothetical protein